MTPVEHTHRHRIRPSTQSVLLPRQIRESRSILYSLSQRALGIPSRAAHTAPHCRTTDVPELQSQQPWEVCISSPSLQIAGVSRDAFPFTTSPGLPLPLSIQVIRAEAPLSEIATALVVVPCVSDSANGLGFTLALLTRWSSDSKIYSEEPHNRKQYSTPVKAGRVDAYHVQNMRSK